MLARSLAVWLGILVLAVLNGVLREAVLLPALGNPCALAASGAILSGLILLTLAFEFGLGLAGESARAR